MFFNFNVFFFLNYTASAFGAPPTFGGAPSFGSSAPAFGAPAAFGSPSSVFGSTSPTSMYSFTFLGFTLKLNCIE